MVLVGDGPGKATAESADPVPAVGHPKWVMSACRRSLRRRRLGHVRRVRRRSSDKPAPGLHSRSPTQNFLSSPLLIRTKQRRASTSEWTGLTPSSFAARASAAITDCEDHLGDFGTSLARDDRL